MPNIVNFQIEAALPFCLVGLGRRPIRGTTIHHVDGKRPMVECADTTIANELMAKHRNARIAIARDLNNHFDTMICEWAILGSPSTTLITDRWPDAPGFLSVNSLRKWLELNCTDDVCILSGAYKKRLSFASEDDYVLAKMSFTRPPERR